MQHVSDSITKQTEKYNMCGSAPKAPKPIQPPSQPPVIVEKAPEVKQGAETSETKRKKVASKDLRVPLGAGKKPASGVGV